MNSLFLVHAVHYSLVTVLDSGVRARKVENEFRWCVVVAVKKYLRWTCNFVLFSRALFLRVARC